MSSNLIFEIEQKPAFKSKTVFNVEIPLLGELTVDETIAVDKAIATDLNDSSANTEWKIVQVSTWLAVRLSQSREDITKQLYQSMPLIEALWLTFVSEREGLTENYELDELDELVAEGNDKEPTVPLKISKKNGIKSTSSSQALDSETNLVEISGLLESA
ncbi:MAG: hypothetical protein IM566_04200 [Pseudanabaena sp. M152S2SP2A07QC]|nr:hypothetical protein [Pseudanabaena sp. M109S1SP2A07QC]MCA6546625.1 hypothetical protein [Pseudanabaena sp. M152S2SP2A07QC]